MRCGRLCGPDYRLYGGTTAIDEPQADEVVGGITIRVRQRNVIISGLKVGDMVDIYDPTGRVYNMIRATGPVVRTAVPTSGVYIIRAGDKVAKAAVR